MSSEKTSTLVVKANGIKSCSCQRNTAILGTCTRDICSENNIIHISSALWYYSLLAVLHITPLPVRKKENQSNSYLIKEDPICIEVMIHRPSLSATILQCFSDVVCNSQAHSPFNCLVFPWIRVKAVSTVNWPTYTAVTCLFLPNHLPIKGRCSLA